MHVSIEMISRLDSLTFVLSYAHQEAFLYESCPICVEAFSDRTLLQSFIKSIRILKVTASTVIVCQICNLRCQFVRLVVK